jgi:S-adenosylmethionine:tRNA ribosyltransferase-isomerase
MTPDFDLPPERAATEPPEARGLARDEVRLLVTGADRDVEHARFHDLGRFLAAGDLVVVNTSATVAAAIDGVRHDGRPVVVHFSHPGEDGTWVVELRRPDGRGPTRDAVDDEHIELAAGAHLVVLDAGDRLSRVQVAAEGPLTAFLERHGRPIAYAYLHGSWPLSAYQTVFGREPGSAEMPSAGRPFTADLVTDLVTAGVVVAPIVLHTGVSSLEAGEPPLPERFRVPEQTARLVNATRAGGGRVIAVGTTVTRALETVATPDGRVSPGAGWTELVLGPERPARAVDGLVTGWHQPGASHLDLLVAVAGSEPVERAYDAALAERYLWHEFGDSCLLLP